MNSRKTKCPEYLNDGAEEEIECVYIYEEESKAKAKHSIKPDKEQRHKVSEIGVYDELDYSLCPHNEIHIETNKTDHDEKTLNDDKRKCIDPKRKKILSIFVVLIACIIGTIITLIILVPQGKNIENFI